SSSRRPPRPCDGGGSIGRRRTGRRGLSSRASAVEGRRLFARVPVLLVGRDDRREDVLVVPVLAGELASAVLLRPALLDADLADEGLTLEVLVLDRACGLRLWAHIVRLEPERRVKDGLEPAVADIDGLGLSVGGADDDEVLPELAGLIEPVDKSELGVEHLAATVFAAFKQATFAGAAGAKVHNDGRDRPVRDELDIPRRWGSRVVKGWHVGLLGLGSLLPG